MKATTKAAKTITAPAIFRICDKVSHNCIGYGVPSNSEPGKTYFVSWNYSRHQYECTCQAGQHGKPCCHVAAVQEVVVARKVLAAPARLVAFFAALAAYTKQEEDALILQEAEMLLREEDAPPDVAVVAAPQRSKPIIDKATAPLGGNKAFSLMR